MQFDKGLLPPNYGARMVWLVVGGCSLSVCIWALVSGFFPATATTSLPPGSSAAPVHISPATLAPVSLTTARASPTLTDRTLDSPVPAVSPPTPAPTATWFYIVPSQPTPIPTPILPPAAPFPASCDSPGRMNILLIGVDGFNSNYYRSARADTIMLLGVSFEAKSAQMVSFPRDLWVPLPNVVQVPEARLNTAYHYGELYQLPGGGPAEVSAIMANSFGVRIDRFVVISFSAFEQGIDAIGGLDVNIPQPIHDARYPLRDGSGTIAIDFPSGWVHLDGSSALMYARIRHDSSDFRRMRRQQQLLFAVRDRLLSPETILQLPALAQSLVGAVRTDLTLEDLALLGCLGPQISRNSIQSQVIEGDMVEAARLPDGAQVLMPRMDALLPLFQDFNVGQ